MNEETIIQPRPSKDGQAEAKKTNGAWKHVTLGGVSGILMGAGLLYAGQAVAANKAEVVNNENATDAQQTENATETSLPVAQMHNEMSFGEAFAAARAEVGPGGVFLWHGGIYNTYTAEEWDAMTPEQKDEFAHQVNPEIQADEIPTPTDHHPDIATAPTVHETEDVSVVNASDSQTDQQVANNFEQEGDVHIVGYTNVEGHLAVGYDTDGDGLADVAIIDVDDNQEVSAPDIIMDNEGNMATIGDVMAEPADAQMASMENPEVAPDMPDYMNDADLSLA